MSPDATLRDPAPSISGAVRRNLGTLVTRVVEDPRVGLSLVTLLALVRLPLVAFVFRRPEVFIVDDSRQYLDLARNLAFVGRYEPGPGFMGLWRPPGYPLFLTPFVRFLGGEPGYVAVAQGLLAALTAILVYRWVSSNLSPRAGLVAALLLVLSPVSAFWTLMVMPATLFALAMFLLAVAAWRYLARPSFPSAVVVGLVCGAATLIRPIAFPLVPLLALGAWAECLAGGRGKTGLRHTAAILVGGSLLVLPWMVRNQIVHGAFTVSVSGRNTLIFYMVADALREAEGMEREEAVAFLAAGESPERRALEVVATYPVAFLQAQVRGVMVTLMGWEFGVWQRVVGGEHRTGSGLVAALLRLDPQAVWSSLQFLVRQGTTLPDLLLQAYALLHGALLFSLAGLGGWRAVRAGGRARKFALLVALVVAYLIIAPGSAGGGRFRVPTEPLLVMLAGFALAPGVERESV